MTLPNFLGIGAMKAGTSMLHTLVEEHPDVAMATRRKEVMFFDRYWDRGLPWYQDHFSVGSERCIGEVTPGYMFHPKAAERIASVIPDVKLFAVLRDPVERAYSQYKFFVKEDGFSGSVRDYLEAHPNALERGLYCEQLARFEHHFDRSQLLWLLFDDVTASPVETVQRVYRHIGVRDDFVPPSAGKRLNASELPRWHRLYALGRRGIAWLYRHDLGRVVQLAKRTGVRRIFLRDGASERAFSPLPPDVRTELRAHYREDVEQLSERLQRDLPALWGW